LGPTPSIPQRNGNSSFSVILPNNVTIEFMYDFSGSHLRHN
jgi:hypothetical protein